MMPVYRIAAIVVLAAAPATPQQECPQPAEFTVAPSRPVVLPARATNVWGVVREALSQWRDSTFRAGLVTGSVDAGPVYVVMESSPAAQVRQAAPELESGHTCFFQGEMKRRRNTDFRIAFWFAIHGAPGQKGGRVLEVRWLSGIKGTGERTWQPEVPEAGQQAESLARRIEAQLK